MPYRHYSHNRTAAAAVAARTLLPRAPSCPAACAACPEAQLVWCYAWVGACGAVVLASAGVAVADAAVVGEVYERDHEHGAARAGDGAAGDLQLRNQMAAVSCRHELANRRAPSPAMQCRYSEAVQAGLPLQYHAHRAVSWR